MNKTIQNFLALTNQLIIHLNRISLDAYAEKLSIFGGATIGEHVRHIYNFPECLLKGVQSGKVNYDKRTRDKNLEINRDYAVKSILEQGNYILNLAHYENIPLILETGMEDTIASTMNTNLKRELHYITEHTIHHFAILRQGFSFHFPEMEIDSSFGFAFSTLEYQKVAMIFNKNI